MIDTKYAAGFFDGEGTVHIGRSQKVSGRRFNRRFDHYYLRIKVGNTNYKVLRKFQMRWGGGMSRYVRDPKWKPAWYWYCASRMAAIFLRDIYPFLVVKKKAARVGLALAENRRKGGPHTKLTKAQQNRQIRLHAELRQINKRGPVGGIYSRKYDHG